jgi:2'-5' RNA ligase
LEKASQALKARAFFGLPLPEAHRAAVAQYLAACAAASQEFRWTPAANLHLTVRFIGTVERSIVDRIADRLGELPLARFELELGDVGTFKRGRIVRVVWLEVRRGGEAVAKLAAQVEAECVQAGLEPEARPFQPHLTLARARPREGAALPPIPAPPELPRWTADELVLYRSHLGRAGSVYEAFRTIKLS